MWSRLSDGYGRVPHEIDVGRTPHLLFEVGSLMTLVFGALFLASSVAVVVAYATGTPVAVGAVAAGLFGLLAANGLGLLYWSTTFDAA